MERYCQGCETEEGNQMAHYGGCLPNYDLFTVCNFDKHMYSICDYVTDNTMSFLDKFDFEWFIRNHSFNKSTNQYLKIKTLPCTRMAHKQFNLPAYCDLKLLCEYNKQKFAFVYNTKLKIYSLRSNRKCLMEAPGDVWCEIKKLF